MPPRRSWQISCQLLLSVSIFPFYYTSNFFNYMYIILTHLGFVCIYAGTKWESSESEMTIILGSLTLILFSKLHRQCGQQLMRQCGQPLVSEGQHRLGNRGNRPFPTGANARTCSSGDLVYIWTVMVDASWAEMEARWWIKRRKCKQFLWLCILHSCLTLGSWKPSVYNLIIKKPHHILGRNIKQNDTWFQKKLHHYNVVRWSWH